MAGPSRCTAILGAQLAAGRVTVAGKENAADTLALNGSQVNAELWRGARLLRFSDRESGPPSRLSY